MKVIVEAPARLHLGFIDLNGECGRVYGSLGVAVNRPRWLLEARRSDRTEVYGESAGEIRGILTRLGSRLGLDKEITIRVLSSIPRHMGFGSGTQLELSVAAAAARLSGRSPSARELAALLGRGARSGIGVAVFERGGFVVDAGRPGGMAGAKRQPAPPVIFQHPLPEDWTFVLATPASAPGLSGRQEEGVFDSLPLMGEEQVGRICRLILMKVIPGVVTNDIRAFGEAVTEIQTLVGEHFAPYQGGVYACATGERIAGFALKRGAYGVGQSSWGPTVFALVRGEADALELAGEIEALVGCETASVVCARASNRGAECREQP